MAILLTVGMILGVLAPLLRRYGKAAFTVLACAASLVIAIVDLLHPDPRVGLAAIDANRRFYRILLAFELPALALTLVSQRLQESRLGRMDHSWAIRNVAGGHPGMAAILLALVATSPGQGCCRLPATAVGARTIWHGLPLQKNITTLRFNRLS